MQLSKHLNIVVIVILFTLSAHAQSFLTNGLVAYYPLNGNANDASGNGYNGTNSSVTWVTNRFGVASGAGQFTGSAKVMLPASMVNLMSGTGAISVSTWVQTAPVNNSGFYTILSMGSTTYCSDFILVTVNGQFYYSGYSCSETGSGLNVNDNTWHQCIAVYNSGIIYLYIDGVLKNSQAVTLNRGNQGGTIGIFEDGTDSWNGNISDVRIYNRALSATDVAQLYAYETPANPPFSLTNGLVAYYPLDGNANDASGNGYSGTNSSVTWLTNRFGFASSAGQFTGSAQITLPSALVNLMSGTSPLSVSSWVQSSPANVNNGNHTLLNIGAETDCNDFALLNVSGQFFYSGWDCSEASSGAMVCDNSWHQCVAVYDGSSIYLYVDGVLKNNQGVTLNRGTAGGTIGARLDGLENWNGNIDDMRIYNRALSSGDVAQLYSIELSPPPQGPPVITVQPLGQTNLVGMTATFNVTVSNLATLSYQWWFGGTNLPGATANSLVLSNLTLGQAGNYYVVVTNSSGSVTSSPAYLDVRSILVSINGQPAAPAVTVGASATVTILDGFTGGFIFYTLDGSTPATGSILYAGPFTLTNSVVLKVLGISEDFSQSVYGAQVVLTVIPGYNVQTAVVGSGTINANPATGPYVSNSVVTLTAIAPQYWVFDHWTGDAGGSQNPLSLTINGPLNIQAVFTPTAYPLTVSTPGGGGVTANGQAISSAVYYPTGTVVALAATASNGWSFIGWQGTASGTNNPLNVTVNQTNNIQAIFGTVVATNATGGGSIVLSQPNPVPYGTILTASAVPAAGKYFTIWSGAASGTNAPTTFVVTNTNPVNALFSSLPGGKYSLAVVVLGSGSVAISPQQNYYTAGTGISLNASTTNAGTQFYGWTGDVFNTNNAIALVMNSSHFIQANFGTRSSVSIFPSSLNILQASNGVLTASASVIPPLSYQWQNSQGAIAGATNASFTIINAQATNADNYSVVVSNPFGSVTSAVVTVTVLFPPAIVSQPMGQIVPAGSTVTLSVNASGTAPLGYQWEDSLGPIPGATTNSFKLDPAQTNNWDNYFVIITNAYGAVTSTPSPLVVYGPVTIGAQPLSRVVPLGSTTSFLVLASGFPAPVYQWTLNGINLAGATSNSLTISNVDVPNLGNYQALINNGYSTNNSYVVTLNAPPAFVSPFTGASTVWGQGATLSVGVIGSGPLSYQWYFNGAVIPGAIGATLSFTSIQFTNAGLYSVTASSPYGNITNTAYQVVVNPANVSLGFYPGMTIHGVTGYSYIIQSSTNLANANAWVTLTNLTLTEPVQLWVDTNVDASSPFNSHTFYQILPGQ